MATGFRVTNIICENPRDKFLSPLRFQFTVEVIHDIPSLSWQLIYVSNPESTVYDQILERFDMPDITNQPYPVTFNFIIECNCPQWQHLQKFDILGANALICQASMNEKEVYRCGFYVFNGYADETLFKAEQEDMTNQTPIRIDQVYRYINTEQPRIKTQIDSDITIQERIQQSQEQQQSLLELQKINQMQMNVNYNDANFLNFAGPSNFNFSDAFANQGSFFSQLDMQNQQSTQYQFNFGSQQSQQSQQPFQQQQQQQFQNSNQMMIGQQPQSQSTQFQQQQQPNMNFNNNSNINMNNNNFSCLDRRQEQNQFNNLNNFGGGQQFNNVNSF